MKKQILFIVLNLVICLTFGQKQYNPYEQHRPTSWQGTGFALNNGYVVTNYHVVDGARSLILKRAVGDSVVQYVGEVIGTDEEHDLAIVKVQGSAWKTVPFSLKTQMAEVGESVFVLGYPMASLLGDEIKLTTGVVSSRTGYQGNNTLYQVSAPIQPGNSGGPLFDEDGNVIAVVNAKVIEEHAENVGYAIKSSFLKTLMTSLSLDMSIFTKTNSLAGLSLPNKVKKAKEYVFSIEASSEMPITKSSNPKYGASVVCKGDKVVDLPYVDFSKTNYARIDRVIVGDKETTIELTALNDGSYTWVNISRETYLRYDGKEYRLLRAEGIQYAPSKTMLQQNKNVQFKLVFGAIPKGATSIDLVEPGESSWKFYGISLKE